MFWSTTLTFILLMMFYYFRLSQDYALYIATKELLMVQNGCTYEAADEFCRLSKIDFKKAIKTRKKQICSHIIIETYFKTL